MPEFIDDIDGPGVRPMREYLVAFITLAQREAAAGRLTTHMSVGDAARGMVWFGDGPFDRRLCLFWPPGGGESVEVPAEEAADRLLDGYGLTGGAT